ncbi:MAG: DUF58 domain-containing protein [Treponema sp.]|jgi:hypothetical protein|nr:DUF58 domain-containing protein [Treponema sp.]
MAPFRFQSVFTPVGFASVAAALAVLIRSLSARNVYEIVLVTALLVLWLILYITGAWGSRRLAALEPGWKAPIPLIANTGEETLVTGFDMQVPWFFRLHFIVKGRFFPAGSPQGCPVRMETSVTPGTGTARLGLSFPMSGVFHGKGFCLLRDIFGFFSFPCGVLQRRSLTVQSAPCLKKAVPIDARSGAEDRRNKSTADEERYYMREYAPGDRFRDINWKSSDRIDTLITRISPDNQEKISRIEVYFRNFGPTDQSPQTRASLQDLWLLDRAKARLARFLRTVKEEQSAYIFSVRTAQDIWEIRDQDELELFLEGLASLPFSPPINENRFSAAQEGAAYVFSTACDAGLPAFLLARQPKPVFLFFVRSAAPKTPADAIERLYLRDFPVKGCIPVPWWLVPRHSRALNPPKLPGSRSEIDYAEVRL